MSWLEPSTATTLCVPHDTPNPPTPPTSRLTHTIKAAIYLPCTTDDAEEVASTALCPRGEPLRHKVRPERLKARRLARPLSRRRCYIGEFHQCLQESTCLSVSLPTYADQIAGAERYLHQHRRLRPSAAGKSTSPSVRLGRTTPRLYHPHEESLSAPRRQRQSDFEVDVD